MKATDSLGRTRRASQGGAGPKNLPTATGGGVTGEMKPEDMPKDLGKYGQAFWLAATESMRRMKTLERADRMVLEIAARIWHRYHEARALLVTEHNYFATNGGKARHPAMITMEKAETVLLKYLSDLGLTPSARAKFQTPAEDDPLEALMRPAALS